MKKSELLLMIQELTKRVEMLEKQILKEDIFAPSIYPYYPTYPTYPVYPNPNYPTVIYTTQNTIKN